MASTQVRQVSTHKRQAGITLLICYLCLYAAMLLAMRQASKFDIVEPLLVFATVGVGFSVAALLLTTGVPPLECFVLKPKKELAFVAAYLLPIAAFTTWGLQAVHRHLPGDPGAAIAILALKLLFFVIVPVIVLRAPFRYRLRELAPISRRTRHLLAMIGMSGLLLAFQALVGRGLRDIQSAHLPSSTLWYGLPLTFLWLAVEAGVVEEFFFRVLLQTRLSAVLRSELGAIVLMSLAFGLAHAPGLYLRTGLTQEGLSLHPSLLMAIGYSIVITSVAGFSLGVLWARTRNFAVVVVVHAMGDLLPNVLPTLRSLRVLS